MKTVGDYKEAGLDVLVGDKYEYTAQLGGFGVVESVGSEIIDGTLEEFTVDWFYENVTITEFVWRTNTGEKPSFDGLIEYETIMGVVYVEFASIVDFSARWDGKLVTSKWRPSLNQGGQVEPKKVTKPTYNKAMQEAGELPPVGCEYLDEDGQLCLCIGYSSEKGFVVGQMVEHPSSNGYPPISTSEKTCVKPIQTEREIAIDSTVDKLLHDRLASCNIDLLKSIIGDLHDLELLKC